MNRIQTRTYASAYVVGLALCCLGCHTGTSSTGFAFTRALTGVAAVTTDWRRDDSATEFHDAISVLATDESMEQTVQAAREAEAARQDSDPRCIDLYATVALECWPRLEETDGVDPSDEIAAATWTAYHYCVAQFVRSAAIHGRLNPIEGVTLATDGDQSPLVAITRHEFPWNRQDFNELQLVKHPAHTGLARYWAENGLGVPMIAVRRRDDSKGFLSDTIPFSATGILRPKASDEAIGASELAVSGGSIPAVLELHDPLRVRQVAYDHGRWNLARDLSAPFEMASSIVDRDKIRNFLNPGRSDEQAGLRMIEPYQPGKAPVVFVHGLLSDKFTWIDLANDLRSVPGFNQNFQIWSFQYPTGQAFIRSAAEMRNDLTEIVHELDPDDSDEALSQMVLIGHSMGGLVSKLQVAGSDSTIWDSVATRELGQIETSPEIRKEIEKMFFFEPLPFVKRVVFIGSPHQGSKMANGFFGKLGSALVRSPRERVSMLQSLVKSNPNVFKGELAHRLPSSVKLLRPDNPILQATYKLRMNPVVRLHTIIGTGRALSDGTPADGVVAVASARHPGTLSERHVKATHTQLTSHPDTTSEIVTILMEHLHESAEPDAVIARK
jgi:hypothetical protein